MSTIESTIAPFLESFMRAMKMEQPDLFSDYDTEVRHEGSSVFYKYSTDNGFIMEVEQDTGNRTLTIHTFDIEEQIDHLDMLGKLLAEISVPIHNHALDNLINFDEDTLYLYFSDEVDANGFLKRNNLKLGYVI